MSKHNEASIRERAKVRKLLRRQGDARIRIQIDNVVLADGTNWNASESPLPYKGQKNC